MKTNHLLADFRPSSYIDVCVCLFETWSISFNYKQNIAINFYLLQLTLNWNGRRHDIANKSTNQRKAFKTVTSFLDGDVWFAY